MFEMGRVWRVVSKQIMTVLLYLLRRRLSYRTTQRSQPLRARRKLNHNLHQWKRNTSPQAALPNPCATDPTKETKSNPVLHVQNTFCPQSGPLPPRPPQKPESEREKKSTYPPLTLPHPSTLPSPPAPPPLPDFFPCASPLMTRHATSAASSFAPLTYWPSYQ